MVRRADEVTERSSAVAGDGPRILVVEDESIVAEDLCQSLRELGYEVPAVISAGEDVVDRAVALHPDLVLMDVILEGQMDGIEAAKSLSDCCNIPVVFLTAHADETTFQRAKQSDPLGYLVKPFDAIQLHHAIEMALYKHRLDERLREYSENLENLVRQRTCELEEANEGLQVLNRELKRQRAEAEQARFEAESSNRAKSEFLASMSHELRTPLTAVIGFAEVLKDQFCGPLGEKQLEYVQNIIGSGRHLLEIINDILDLAKVESGTQEIEYGKISLKAFLTSALSLVGERARRHGITVSLEMDDDAMIDADARKLKQVMVNLLGNAVKFTPDGGSVTVEATVLRDPSPDPLREPGIAREVSIKVRDTGIGIHPEDLPRLFDKFTQFTSPLARKHEGTGLGLALAKRLVELHGGTIGAESEVGHGSVFTVTIPARQALERVIDTRGGGARASYGPGRRRP